MTAAKVENISDKYVERLEQIDIADLRIAIWNARKTFDPARTEELKSSLEAHGIQVPLIVRPIPGPAYEIVAGHRRFYAALSLCEKGNLKFEYLPCMMRNLNDDQAREIGLIDNLQREDVPALEEADAYAELQGRLGTVAAIAQRVGKDVSYVARRLQLCSLGDFPRKALAERLITIDHALLLARLGVDEQDAALKYTLRYDGGTKTVEAAISAVLAELKDQEKGFGYWEPCSVLSLKEHIEEEVGRKLSRAPWKLDDAELLPEAGACTKCPHNTKANNLLFGDLAIDEATCANGSCFKQKTEAFVRIQMRTSDGTDTPIRLSWKSSSAKPKMAKDGTGVDAKAVIKRGQWVAAKPKSCTDVRIGVTIDWDESWGDDAKKHKPGQVLTVCIAEKCKAHKKDWQSAAAQSARAQVKKEDPAVAEKRRKEDEHRAKVESQIRAKVYAALLGKLNVGAALRLIATRRNNMPARRKALLEAFPKLPGDLLEALAIFDAEFGHRVRADAYWMNRNGIAGDRKELWEMAKSVGVDADGIVVKHFDDAKGIAPSEDQLYPKGRHGQVVNQRDARKAAPKAAKKPAKKAAKKAGRK